VQREYLINNCLITLPHYIPAAPARPRAGGNGKLRAALLVLRHGLAARRRRRRLWGPLLLRCSYLGGPATSVWNHGTTSCLAQLADRAAMAVGCALDVCYMATLPLPQAALLSLGNGAAVAAYCLAKRQATRRVATAWHLASHACVSASHGAMLYFLGLRARPARAPSAHAQRTRPAHTPSAHSR
jgi:hypothetical protein